MNNNTDTLILGALLGTPTIREAAKLSNVSEGTIYNRLKDPDFKKKYNELKTNMLEQQTNKLLYYSDIAIDTLGSIMEASWGRKDNTRIQAADCILRNRQKMADQLEIIQRLDDLENK